MRALALIAALACAGAQADDAAYAQDPGYQLQPVVTSPYRLHQIESPRISDVERRQARHEALHRLPFAAQIEQAAQAGGIEPELLHAVVQAESAYNPHAVSPKGALGLAQMLPETARAYGVRDALKPADNLRASAEHLRDLLDVFGDLELALSAYNAGAGAVRKYGGVPPFPETRAYVPKVTGRYEALKKRSAVTPPPAPASPYKLRAQAAELRLVQPQH
jgi:soluble lytic murein transglycosylase-like protein